MAKKGLKEESFEKNLEEIDRIIERLDNEDILLEDSIKEYEKAMKLLKKSSDILNEAQGKIVKINDNLMMEDLEEDKGE